MAIRCWSLLLTWCGQRRRNLWVVVFLLASLLYAWTARWSTAQISDAYGAAWAGWQLVHAGSFDVSAAPGLSGGGASYVIVGSELRAARMAGVILAGVPFHLALMPFGVSATTSGTLAAVVLSAAAVANMAVVLHRLVPVPFALVSTGTIGLGTAMWTISADQLWSHGPNAFWLSCALVLVVRNAPLAAGSALALAVITRPHLALVAAVLGVAWTIRDHSVHRLLAIGVPGGAAVGFLQWWNGWYYGSGSVGGGYTYAADNVARAPWDAGAQYLEALAGTLVSPVCGVLVYTPITVLALLALRRHRAVAPWWAWAAAVGGVLYLAVQMRISADFSGGGGFYSNRYAVETLVLAAPLCVAVLHSWCSGSAVRRAVAGGAAALSVAIHAYGEILSYALVGLGTRSNWVAWYPYHVGRAAGYVGIVAALTGLLFVALAALLAHRSLMPGPPASPPAVDPDPSRAVPAQRPGAAASTRR